ncbi:B12-binding domain-containing radical SAM protein [Geobacter sp. AOG2]|uniref:B12-binding domain-containing radical SAM protein n=1 Tax=Geobacter sp. AOG2 TaxID=1566347 RepID=UPI001CC701F1|nr:radical SAM protein [Geobacter sp. AOG2]GFE61054.1 B12-binding domain-containing radical SAM protein [Geobacter sp. AOG2]
MKVLFVHPHGSNFMPGVQDITTIFNIMPPLGIMSIAAWLERHGIEVEIIDCYATPMEVDDLADEVIRRKPDAVGFSTTTSAFHEGYRIASAVKERDAGIVTVFGGAHPCTMGAPLLDGFPAIDFLVIGEGEQTMLELAQAGFMGAESLPGIAFRRDGRGVATAPRELIANLDDLPFPAYHLLPGFPKRYTLPLFSFPTAPNTSIISSRGCPYACSYCDRSVFSRGFRFNSPEYIVEHVAMLNRNYGIRHVFFYDDLFTFDRKRVAEFCDLKAKKRLNVTYNCIARLEHVDAELLSLLKRSGCWQVNFGIESGDPEVLRKHRKFYGLDEVGMKLQMVKKAGMRVKGLFMIGLPGEDETAIRRTIDYALSLPLEEINVTKFTPFPGAPIYKTIREQGEFDEKWELMNCMNFVFVPTGMTKDQLEELYNEFIRRFYHRTRIHWGYTKMIWKSPHSILAFLRNLPEILAFERKQKW